MGNSSEMCALPTKPGFYWRQIEGYEPEVVKVVLIDRDGIQVTRAGMMDIEIYYYPNTTITWQGPLTPSFEAESDKQIEMLVVKDRIRQVGITYPHSAVLNNGLWHCPQGHLNLGYDVFPGMLPETSTKAKIVIE